MAKKKPKAVSRTRQNALNRQRFLASLPNSEKEWLERLLWFTERAIQPNKDQNMIAQAARIKSKIAQLA